MKYMISHLSSREWNQVRAALKFWRDMAEVSRQHPSSHPGVAGMFEKHGPLNLTEIDNLLEHTPEATWVTVQQVADDIGVDKRTVSRAIEKQGVEPSMVVGGAGLYRIEPLLPVIEKLRRNRAKFARWKL